MTKIDVFTPQPGQRVRVTHAEYTSPDSFEGTFLRIDSKPPVFGPRPSGGVQHPYVVQVDRNEVDGYTVDDQGRPCIWAAKVEPVERPAARPTIDFSGDSRATAREYAVAANSRILDTKHQETLKAVAAGEVVDALDVNAAVTQAMSSAATRVGQSMGRRELTRKIRHLGYIAQAVLENAVDQLPVYETGERSRKIAELQRELAHQGDVNQSLTRDLTQAREKLRAAEAEVRDNHAQAVDEGAALQEHIDALAASLDYALGVLATLDKPGAYQVLGFMDAHGVEITD